MSGTTYIVIGIVIIVLGSLGFAVLQLLIIGKKKRMKEQYHIYE